MHPAGDVAVLLVAFVMFLDSVRVAVVVFSVR